MADYPDVYADGFSLSAGAYGVTLTLTRSEPTGEPGPHEEPMVIIARVRMTANLAYAIAASVKQVVDQAQQAIPLPPTGKGN
jgi:hypothetical protein